MQNNTVKEHNYLIDCFRILAVLMVLSVHIRADLDNVPSIIYNLFGFGAYGVALYFIISGFLSYRSVVKCKSLGTYVRKKTIRILPMYYVSLILTFIIGGLVLEIYPIDFKWIYHIFFLNMFIPSKDWSWWNSVNFFWTMPAFIAWYLISYPLFKKINSSKKMAIITLITAIAAPFLKKIMYHFASEQFVNWNFFCLIYAFCLGALAYFVIKEKCHLMGMLYGVVIGCLGLIANNRSGFFVFGLLFYFAIVAGSMIPIRWENEKVNKAVKTLSAITYSTYLTHWFVVQLIGDWFKLLPWFVAYILFIVIANIIGYLFYVFVEKYFAKILTDRFLNKELGNPMR